MAEHVAKGQKRKEAGERCVSQRLEKGNETAHRERMPILVQSPSSLPACYAFPEMVLENKHQHISKQKDEYKTLPRPLHLFGSETEQ